MNIFRREMRADLKAFIIWAIVVAFFLGAGLTKFTGVKNGGAEITDVINAYPPLVRAVMGMGSGNMATFTGFYMVMEFYIGIILAFYAAQLGRSAVSREMVGHTYEFLFVRPRSRSWVLSMKLLAGAVYLVVMCMLNFLLSAAVAQSLDLGRDYTSLYVRSSAWCAVVGFVFFAVGAAVAGLVRKPESGAKWANVAVLVGYVATVGYDAFSDHEAAANIIRVFSPLRYTTPSQLLAGEWSVGYTVVACAVIAGSLAIAFRRFTTQDLSEQG
ncbi:MAG: ABC transporter permease [Bifidobacteriaceae bacterium]|jgi:ABC-2 type transport system permease protein|nr:ABC transporter permease [Bifidobacteriaceae bacterium]